MSRRGAGPLRPPWSGPLGLYRPAATVLHRAPAGAKVVGLLAFGILTVVLRGHLSALAALALALAAAWVGRLPWRTTARALRPLVVICVVLGAYQWWTRGWSAATEVTADLLALVLAATVVTATTPSDALLSLLERAAHPVRRLGVHPPTLSLAAALMLRAIPALLTTSAEARDAARARGLGRSPRAVLVPATVRMVARAHRTGAALEARGLGD